MMIAAGTVLAGGAWAQAQPAAEPPKAPQPLDINDIQPVGQPGQRPPANRQGEPVKVAPAQEKAAGAATSDQAAQAPVNDGEKFQISRFIIEYKNAHPDHPSIEDLMQAKVRLGVTPDGYVAPREGVSDVTMRLGDIAEGGGGTFFRSGINAVGAGIVEELNRRGFLGIFVQLHPEDADLATGADKRGGARSEFRLIVWTGKVRQVRTISSGPRLDSELQKNPELRINNADPVHERIRAQSPVQDGDLLRKQEMDDFVFRLNRHPGRRVDVAISPGAKPEDVVVDYLVTESKPWSVYAQLSNTGTKTTNEWRERFGFVHNQLTGHDDILRLDYSTGGFQQSHALLASYEFPLLSDAVRVRAYGGFTKFEASEIGLADEQFSGEAGYFGAEASGTIYQYGELFVDLVGGARYKSEKVTNDLFDLSGRENFFIPYAGVKMERNTDSSSTFADLTGEFLWPDITSLDKDDLQNMGRLNVDDSWQIAKFDVQHSFFLEPLLNPRGYKGQTPTGTQTLAHEIAVGFRGQYSFGYRLVPSEEEVAGGMFSVRGYPESTVAGDTLIIGTAEYRFHVPRAMGVAEPGTFRGKKIGWFGPDFRWQPQQPFGRADWDWVLKAFVDVARNTNSSPLPGEDNFTLVGAGIGTELQWQRNLSMRLDWGFALKDVDDQANPVDAGDNELHFSVTVLY